MKLTPNQEAELAMSEKMERHERMRQLAQASPVLKRVADRQHYGMGGWLSTLFNQPSTKE